jgi:hypothetical protein
MKPWLSFVTRGDIRVINALSFSAKRRGVMSEANKLLVRRWFEQVWNQKSEAAIDEMFSPQGKSHGFPDADAILVIGLQFAGESP